MINAIATMAQLVGNRIEGVYTNARIAQPEAAAVDVRVEEGRVNLSERGRLAVEAEQGALESYRLPAWMADLIPEQSVLNVAEAIQETRAHLSELERMASEGQDASARRAFTMDRLANHSPATRQMHADAAFRAEFRNELSEYVEILRQVYHDARQGGAISPDEDEIGGVGDARDDTAALRGQVMSALLDNPRALDLMDMLGVVRPSLE